MAKNKLINFLESELASGKYKSLTKYSGFLNVSTGTLSEIMSGKRKVTLKKFDELMSCYPDLSTLQIEEIKNDLIAFNSGKTVFESLTPDEVSKVSSIDQLRILALFTLDNFLPNVSWISTSLGLEVDQTRKAVDELISLGLVNINEAGQYELQKKYSFHDMSQLTKDEITAFHEEQFFKASKAHLLEKERKSVGHLTLAINRKNVDSYKKRIRAFMEELAFEASQEESCDDIYQLNLAFYSDTTIYDKL